MPADLPPNVSPNMPGRCPRRLLGEGPRCLSLVLARDADEHEDWHVHLDELLTAPVDVEHPGLEVGPWAGPSDPAQVVVGAPPSPGL